jgi:primary-amine oxidase
MLGGLTNSLEVLESHRLPLSSPTIHSPLGVGYTTTSQIVAHETGLDTSAATARTFKLINGCVCNRTTGTPVAYQPVPHPTQPRALNSPRTPSG